MNSRCRRCFFKSKKSLRNVLGTQKCQYNRLRLPSLTPSLLMDLTTEARSNASSENQKPQGLMLDHLTKISLEKRMTEKQISLSCAKNPPTLKRHAHRRNSPTDEPQHVSNTSTCTKNLQRRMDSKKLQIQNFLVRTLSFVAMQ